MKRILIIALASIFLVNILALIPQAKTIYNNGTITSPEGTTGSSGTYKINIRGDYNITNTDNYKITINIPKVNGQTINSFQIQVGLFITIIDIQNGQITSYDRVSEPIYKNGKITFYSNGVTANGNNFENWIGINYKLEPSQTVTIEQTNNIIEIDNNEKTVEEILIDNVKNAPKDVLREIIAILPVLLTVCIAYIATRKGISFIRSILESA